MIQQSLFCKMVELADKYKGSEKTKYQAAAKKFRLPYWDYFRPRGAQVKFPGIINNGVTTYKYDFSLPKIFTEETIMIKKWDVPLPFPMKNPFRSYTFPAGGIRKEEWASAGKGVSGFFI